MKSHLYKRLLFLAVLAAVAALGAFGGDRPATAQGQPDDAAIQKAIAAQERHTHGLLQTDGVVGTAVGLTDDGRPVVKVYAERGGVRGLPSSVDGVPVVVEVTGKITALAKPEPKPRISPAPSVVTTARFARPVPIGVSSGNEYLISVDNILYCTTGTLGARVKAGTNVFALSNAHVYAQEGSQAVLDNGTLVTDVTGSRILQPGRADDGCTRTPGTTLSDNTIGTLANKTTINLDGVTANRLDAAIAATTTGNVGQATPANGYGTPSSGTVAAALKMPVQKYGRTTQLTRGTVSGVNVTIRVGYDNGTALFTGQIQVTTKKGAFIKGGDSGSLLITNNDAENPVGLLFAGNGSGSFAFANQIGEVLTAFAVTVDGR